MPFEYNGNLLEEERINQVAKEIIKKYNITLEKAQEAALLEGKITKKTIEDELNRLYNIMLVNRDNKKIVAIVYKDFLKILSKNINNKYIDIIDDINLYLNNNIEFPII